MKYPDTELQDAWANSADDIRADLIARRAAPDYKPPHADLGYCACGTVWNIEAMAAQNFVKGTCPDCGEQAIEKELAKP
jgi:hypothetical protein